MMKTLVKYARFTSLIFAILIFLQSCAIYKEGTYSLEQVANTEDQVKLKTTDNKRIKYKKVEFADGGFYGIKKNKEMTRIPIKDNTIKYVKIKDKSLSTIATIATPIVIIGAFIGIRAIIFDNMSFDFSWE